MLPSVRRTRCFRKRQAGMYYPLKAAVAAGEVKLGPDAFPHRFVPKAGSVRVHFGRAPMPDLQLAAQVSQRA
jgi:hypothetical protein